MKLAVEVEDIRVIVDDWMRVWLMNVAGWVEKLWAMQINIDNNSIYYKF